MGDKFALHIEMAGQNYHEDDMIALVIGNPTVGYYGSRFVLTCTGTARGN